MNDIFCPKCFAILVDCVHGHITVEEAENEIKFHGDTIMTQILEKGFKIHYIPHE